MSEVAHENTAMDSIETNEAENTKPDGGEVLPEGEKVDVKVKVVEPPKPNLPKDPKKIQIVAESYVAGPTEVVVPNGDGELTLYVHELGYMFVEELFNRAAASGGAHYPLAMVMAEAIEDSEGRKFTVDEIMRLKKEVSKPLLAAVISVNGLKEKN